MLRGLKLRFFWRDRVVALGATKRMTFTEAFGSHEGAFKRAVDLHGFNEIVWAARDKAAAGAASDKMEHGA